MDHMHLSDFYSEGKERKIRIAVKKREYRNATLNIDGYKHSMVQIIALAVALKIKICPLVLNTSFNDKGQPIVMSPELI